jgi:hypothetical protein
VEQLLNDCTAPFADHRSKDGPVLVRVDEELAAERKQALVGRCRRQRLTLAFLKGRAQSVDPAREEIFLTVEMRLERRAPNIRPGDDVLHGQRLESLFLDKRY